MVKTYCAGQRGCQQTRRGPRVPTSSVQLRHFSWSRDITLLFSPGILPSNLLSGAGNFLLGTSRNGDWGLLILCGLTSGGVLADRARAMVGSLMAALAPILLFKVMASSHTGPLVALAWRTLGPRGGATAQCHTADQERDWMWRPEGLFLGQDIVHAPLPGCLSRV